MTENREGATGQGGAAKLAADEAAQEVEVADNAELRGEAQLTGGRDRGEVPATKDAAPIDFETVRERAS